MSDIIERFPDLLALGEIREQEEHEYQQIEYDDGSTSDRTRYTPDKAPVLELERIVGISNGETFEFTEGVDYEIIDTDDDGRLETVDFGIGGESPDPGTKFEITYIAQSILNRYVGSYETEIHRFRRDIDYVIDSHYISTALDSQYVDNFEDEELVEYIFESGDGSDANVQNTVAFNGEWGLELRNVSSSTCTRISSTNGLWTYPQRADTIELPVQFTDTDDELSFDFMYQDSGTNREQYYRVTLSAEQDELTVQKDGGSVKSDATSINFSQYINEWIIVEIDIGGIDTFSATVETESSQTLGSSQIVDTEYVSGGIRLELCNSSKQSTTYVDAINVTDRNNVELDQIGALFGELGLRRGRDDENYATFLRSIVQSFSGRGTVDGIEFAVASVLDVDQSLITVVEDFSENTYSIRIPANPTVDPDGQQTFANSVSTIYDIAQIADPSGIEFDSPLYDVGDDISESSASSFERATVTNTRALRWDSSDYDTFDWDSDTPGDLQENEDRYEDSIEANTSLLRRYDSGDTYDTFNWSGRSGTETTLTSDVVIEDIAVDAAIDDADLSVSDAVVRDIVQFVDETDVSGVSVNESVTNTESDSATLDDLSEETVTADAQTHTSTSADTVVTTISELTFWNDSNWEDSNWTA